MFVKKIGEAAKMSEAKKAAAACWGTLESTDRLIKEITMPETGMCSCCGLLLGFGRETFVGE